MSLFHHLDVSLTRRGVSRRSFVHYVSAGALAADTSRADLARLTGLQPSTVSVIISLLIDEGWVLPGTLGRLPRGRRPARRC